MSAELNRRIAEADGWRCVMENDTAGRPTWVMYTPGGQEILRMSAGVGVDVLWRRVLELHYKGKPVVPNVSGDPFEALARLELAGKVYNATVKCCLERRIWIVEIIIPHTDVMIDGVADIWRRAFTGEAATFAEAAAEAWCQWKEAVE